MKSPIERMIDAAVKCLKCGVQGVGNCKCWEPKIIYPRRMYARKGRCEGCGHSFTGHQARSARIEEYKPNRYLCIDCQVCTIERERTKKEIEEDRIAGYE